MARPRKKTEDEQPQDVVEETTDAEAEEPVAEEKPKKNIVHAAGDVALRFSLHRFYRPESPGTLAGEMGELSCQAAGGGIEQEVRPYDCGERVHAPRVAP